MGFQDKIAFPIPAVKRFSSILNKLSWPFSGQRQDYDNVVIFAQKDLPGLRDLEGLNTSLLQSQCPRCHIKSVQSAGISATCLLFSAVGAIAARGAKTKGNTTRVRPPVFPFNCSCLALPAA
jgi:hypothetical protein